MGAFIVYDPAEAGDPKTVIRYGEAPDSDIQDQAANDEVAVAVSQGQMANFNLYTNILENAPETTGDFVSKMTYYTDDGTLGFFLASAISSEVSIRQQRDILLRDSDWTQLADAPLTATKKGQWATYRQALRDITSQPGYPGNVTWPTAPS